ncbi:hypothetical protein OQH60_05960 [Campylobacter sp. MIT 21-1685]|uniref:lysozyme inhibitor LprI family protein n=1 Tax=unclassified Campylobacter TaxID=2593542 RepID=UPI00224A77CD|nr:MULTISPECIES: hypothetical protein [unclassified Campylobacter]MCX2683385.1 hypothetical protein [Campylobacter sp. MIT 21-1684]MCX2751688.1 hypothetical protein [Campylobacter sp. MIT 21-1682]MCX2807890.1 hypothetical protein [Campylobacter sp. MIT 21-1685]
MKNKSQFLKILCATLFAGMLLANIGVASQNNTTKQTNATLLEHWSDIEEFSHFDYFYAPYSGISRLSSNAFSIKILKRNENALQLGFLLQRVINGGARFRDWGNEGSCYKEDESKDGHIALLQPLSSTKAQILFPTFPQCKLMAQRDSKHLSINIEEQKANKACAFLLQKCESDVGEEYYIPDEYYKLKAGFDCTKARSASEKSICSNPSLADQDRVTNVLYLGAREYIKNLTLEEVISYTYKDNQASININELDSKLINTLQQELETRKTLILKELLNTQRAYLKKRESCRGNAKCIKKVMSERFDELDYPFPREEIRNIDEALQKFISQRKD